MFAKEKKETESEPKGEENREPSIAMEQKSNNARTMLSQLVPGHNRNIFGIIKKYTLPVKTNGTDFMMILSVVDESIKKGNRDINVKVFFKNIEDFPRIYERMQVIIKIPLLTVKQDNLKYTYLLDRPMGMFLFKVDRDGPSYFPYASAPACRVYTEGSIDQNAIFSLSNHFFLEISIGTVPFSFVGYSGILFSTFGYVQDIQNKTHHIRIILIDMLKKKLIVRLWSSDDRELPAVGQYILLHNLIAKEVTAEYVLCNIGIDTRFVWQPEDIEEYREIAEPIITSRHKKTIFSRIFGETYKELEAYKSICPSLSELSSNVEKPAKEEEPKKYLSIKDVLDNDKEIIVPIEKDSPLYREILTLEVRRVFTMDNKQFAYSLEGLKIFFKDTPREKVAANNIAMYKGVSVSLYPLSGKESRRKKGYLVFIKRKKTQRRIFIYLPSVMWTFPSNLW